MILTALIMLKDVALFPFVKWSLAAVLREKFATNLTVESMTGNLISDLQVRGLTIKPLDEDSILEFLDADEIVLHYHLPALLAGWKNFLHNIHCDISRARVTVTLDGEAAEPHTTESDSPAAIPLFLPGVTLHDSTVLVKMGGGDTVQATGLALRFGISRLEEPFSSRLSAEHLIFSKSGRTLFSAALEGVFFISETGVAIERFLLADREIIRQGSFTFARHEAGTYSFAGDLLPFAGTLRLDGALSGKLLKLSLAFRDFDLEKASAWLPQAGGMVSGKLQAAADLAVHLGPRPFCQGTFSVAALDGSLRDYPVQKIAVKGTIDQSGITLEEAAATTPFLEARLHHFSLAHNFSDPVQLSELLAGLRGGFTLRTRDIPGLFHALGVDGGTSIAGVPSHELSLVGRIADRMVHFDQGFLTSKTVQVVIDDSFLELPAPGQNFSHVPVGMHLRLQADRLEDVAAIFSLPDIAGKANAEIDLTGSLATLAGTGHVSANGLSFKNMALGNLKADLVADSKTVQIRNFSLENSGDVLRGTGALRLADRHLEHVQLAADFQKESSLLAALLPDSVVCKGRVRATATGQGPLTDPDFSLDLEAGELSAGAFPVTEVGFSLKKEKTHVDIGHLSLQSPYGKLNALASAVKDAVKGSYRYTVTSLDIGSDSNLFALTEKASGQIAWPRVTLESLQLQNGRARVGVSGVLDIQGNSSVEITASGLSSELLPPSLLEDRFRFQDADVSVQFEGPLQNPALHGKGSVAEITAPQLASPLHGSFNITCQNSRLTLEKFLWTSSEGIHLEAGGTVPFQPGAIDKLPDGPLSLQARITIPKINALEPFIPDLRTAGGTLDMDLDLSGTWRDPLGHIRFNGHNITVPETMNSRMPVFSLLSMELQATRDVLVLQNAKVLAAGAAFSLQGRWTNPPGLARLRSGQWQDGELQAEAVLAVADIGIFPLPIEGVNRLSGSLKAEATLDAKPESLQFGGTVSLENGELHAEFLPSTAQEISLKADFDHHGITLQQMSAELGGAPLHASGTINFSDGGLITDLQLKGENLLLARDDGILIRSDAGIVLTGPLASWNITGDMAITEGRITRQLDFLSRLKGDKKPKASGGTGLFSFPSPPLRDAHLNIKITAVKPLVIRNNLFNGTVRPQLALKGTGELPYLEGKVYIDPSRLKLPAGKLRIDAGIVSFSKDNPDLPALDIKAGSKMAGYDIAVQIHGNIEEPEVTISSVPPVPNQLLLLLLTGQPPTQETFGKGRRKGTMKFALYFGRDFLTRWLSDEEADDESVLERFDIDIGRDITKSGDDTIEASFELGRDIFKRQGVYFITAEKDVYDNFNMGFRIVFRLTD
jgi:autotransporter translocation and assembly factor TamB